MRDQKHHDVDLPTQTNINTHSPQPRYLEILAKAGMVDDCRRIMYLEVDCFGNQNRITPARTQLSCPTICMSAIHSVANLYCRFNNVIAASLEWLSYNIVHYRASPSLSVNSERLLFHCTNSSPVWSRCNDDQHTNHRTGKASSYYYWIDQP